MASTYWEKLAEETEATSQRVAADRMKYIRQLHREAVAKARAGIDALYAQILDRGAESVTRTQLWQFSKYQALLQQIDSSVTGIRKAQDSAVEQTIRKVFTDTIGTTLDAVVGKGRWTFQSDAVIDQYMKTPWSGEFYSKRIWTNTSKLASDLKSHMEDMLVLGKSPGAVKKQLMTDFGVSYEMADRLVMTETSNAYNTAAMESYRAAGVKKVRWILGPAEGRCTRCQTYAMENGGIYDIDDAPHIPVHPRCRCRWVAIVDIEARTAEINEKMLSELQAAGYTSGDIADIINSVKYASASPVYLSRADQLYEYAKKIKPIKRYEDVVVHGDETGFVFRNANGVESNLSVVAFAEILRETPSYNGGNIRLISCDTGAAGAVSAQALADELQVTVLAPSKTVFIDWDGNMVIADNIADAAKGKNTGKWKKFRPRR